MTRASFFFFLFLRCECADESRNVPKRVCWIETLKKFVIQKSIRNRDYLPRAETKTNAFAGKRAVKSTRAQTVYIYKFIMQRMTLSSISSVSQSQTRFLFSSSSSSAKRHAKSSSNNIARRNVLVVRGAASSDENNNNTVELAAGIGGLVSCCVVGVSLFTLKNTGA